MNSAEPTGPVGREGPGGVPSAAAERPANARTRKIRVAHLIHSMAFGGVDAIVLNWIGALDPERFAVYLFCFRNPGGTEKPFEEEANKAGWTVRGVPWGRRKPLWRAARVMAAQVRELGIDILHCHNCYADFIGPLVARMTGVKTITTVYAWLADSWKRSLLQWLDLRSMRWFDQVTAHCEEALRGAVQRGMPAERIKLLTCGFAQPRVHLSREERDRQRAELGAGPQHVVLIHVARFWPEKAHDILVDAFRLILLQCPETRLWMAGVGPDQPKIEALVKELGLDPAVRFLGFRDDLPQVLALADLQVHSSYREGVPLAILSGMAQGLPIVATRVGGIPEVLQDGHSAVLAPAGRPDVLAQATLDLMADRDRQVRLGRAARRFIEEEYSLAEAVKRVASVYEDLVAK